MTIRFLLDTNIVIEVLGGKPEPLEQQMRRHSGQLAVSTITVAELGYGVARSQNPEHDRASVEGFLPFVEVLDLDTAGAEHAGDIRAELARVGTPIGGYDLLIAGIARSRGLTVVTNNRREFDRVSGLLVVDWTTPD